MKSRPANRKFILARNVMLIALSLLFLWFLFDTPALTSEQAFRRAMREHFLAPQDPQVFFGEDGRLSALAEVDGIYVQVGVEKRGLKWQHGLWTETEAVDGVYIVPLVAYGSSVDSPEVAVLAEGNRADLAFVPIREGRRPWGFVSVCLRYFSGNQRFYDARYACRHGSW